MADYVLTVAPPSTIAVTITMSIPTSSTAGPSFDFSNSSNSFYIPLLN